MTQTQTFIPGTEPAGYNPDVQRALDAWLEAKNEQRNAAATVKLQHDVLIRQCADAGLDSYQYTDPTTGKKRTVFIAREPKVKTSRPAARSVIGPADDDDAGDDEPKARGADKVEMRRVPRSTVKEADADPFAATRAAMDEKPAKKAAKKAKK